MICLKEFNSVVLIVTLYVKLSKHMAVSSLLCIVLEDDKKREKDAMN